MVDISAVGGSLAGGFAQGMNEGIRNISAVQGIRQNQEQMEMTREKMGMEKEQNALAQITTRQQHALNKIELENKERQSKLNSTPMPVSEEIQNNPNRKAFLIDLAKKMGYEKDISDVEGRLYAPPFVQNAVRDALKSNLEIAKADHDMRFVDASNQLGQLTKQRDEMLLKGVKADDPKFADLQNKIALKDREVGTLLRRSKEYVEKMDVAKLGLEKKKDTYHYAEQSARAKLGPGATGGQIANETLKIAAANKLAGSSNMYVAPQKETWSIVPGMLGPEGQVMQQSSLGQVRVAQGWPKAATEGGAMAIPKPSSATNKPLNLDQTLAQFVNNPDPAKSISIEDAYKIKQGDKGAQKKLETILYDEVKEGKRTVEDAMAVKNNLGFKEKEAGKKLEFAKEKWSKEVDLKLKGMGLAQQKIDTLKQNASKINMENQLMQDIEAGVLTPERIQEYETAGRLLGKTGKQINLSQLTARMVENKEITLEQAKSINQKSSDEATIKRFETATKTTKDDPAYEEKYMKFLKNETGARTKPSGLTEEKIDLLYADYLIASAKAPGDPIKQQMRLTLKTMGIETTDSFPKMTKDQFRNYVRTGTIDKPIVLAPIEALKANIEAAVSQGTSAEVISQGIDAKAPEEHKEALKAYLNSLTTGK